MKILFIHPNMPGQYKHLVKAFADKPEHTVVFITKPKSLEIPGVHKVEYLLRRDLAPSTHRYLGGVERAVLQGQEVWRLCKKLRDDEGFVPDVICAHPGWGDALYVKDIFPTAKLLSFFEFYYHAQGADVHFDPEFPAKADDLARVRTKNITNLLNLEACDWGFSPTMWQHSLHPKEFHHKMSVIHDGVDMQAAKPNPNAMLTLSNGLKFKRGDKLVTYIARNFEPYRGFPTFMRAAEIILRERKDCHIIAVGADEVSYGRKLDKGKTWRHIMSEQVKLDANRIHFPGVIPHAQLMELFQVSDAHIYLSYPFVLSWSMLESMACGVPLIASRTPPIQEVIQDGVNGLLADIFSPEEVAAQVLKALEAKDGMQAMREAAHQTVKDRYDLNTLLPLHVSLVEDLARGELPPPTAAKITQLHAGIQYPPDAFHQKKPWPHMAVNF